jgi:hypothetical protein
MQINKIYQELCLIVRWPRGWDCLQSETGHGLSLRRVLLKGRDYLRDWIGCQILLRIRGDSRGRERRSEGGEGVAV